MGAGLPLVDKPLFVSQSAVQFSAAVDVAGCEQLCIYISTEGGVSGGSMLIEESPDKDFPGAWAQLGLIASTGVTTVRLVGTAKFVRANINQQIVGGTVSAILTAR